MKLNLAHLATIGFLTVGMNACSLNREINPKQLAKQNAPGTVIVEAIHNAEISVPNFEVDDTKARQLEQTLIHKLETGEISSKQQAMAILANELYLNPLQYFRPIDEIFYQQAQVTTTGTGAVITEDGYIVTNAHVVSSDNEDVKQSLAETALTDVAIDNCQQTINDLPEESMDGLGQTIGTREFQQLCVEGTLQFFAHHMALSQVNTKVYAAVGAVAPNTDLSKQGYLAEVQSIGEPAPGKDVAVLKIQASDLPTVTMGDDRALATGDRIYVLGYPTAAIISDNQKNMVSLTSGLVSARKTMPDNWDLLQTDAAMSQGNSGGPVFNDRGEMIGIATFGITDTIGAMVQGANFVVPVSVAKEFLPGNILLPASHLSQVSPSSEHLSRSGLKDAIVGAVISGMVWMSWHKLHAANQGS